MKATHAILEAVARAEAEGRVVDHREKRETLKAVVLELPYPPSMNHYWRHVGNRTLISRQGRTFRAAVVRILGDLGIKPLAGPVKLEADVYPPDGRRRDLDNVMKALLDALQHGGAYLDDGQIVKLVLTKCEPAAPDGKTLVKIEAA